MEFIGVKTMSLKPVNLVCTSFSKDGDKYSSTLKPTRREDKWDKLEVNIVTDDMNFISYGDYIQLHFQNGLIPLVCNESKWISTKESQGSGDDKTEIIKMKMKYSLNLRYKAKKEECNEYDGSFSKLKITIIIPDEFMDLLDIREVLFVEFTNRKIRTLLDSYANFEEKDVKVNAEFSQDEDSNESLDEDSNESLDEDSNESLDEEEEDLPLL